MGHRLRYKKKSNQYVIAVQLNLDTDGFTYRKWGAEQRCKSGDLIFDGSPGDLKSGDWVLDNKGDFYSVDKDVFERTYRQVKPGYYVKSTPIWAEVATLAGSVITKEGKSHYQAGDYLVSNNEDGTDAYCISADKFESMYELDE